MDLDVGDRLALGTWNIISLAGKEPELVCEAELYKLDIFGLASTHSLGSGTHLMERRWTISYSEVSHGKRHWAGKGIPTSLKATRLIVLVLEFSPVIERVVFL